MQKQPVTPKYDSPVAYARAVAPRWLALIPGGLAFILYLLTCSPAINFTDSGELVTAAWTGGVPHPPGYPLYTLLSTIAVHIPFGDPAWRMNVLSALFGAVAVALFYGLVTDTLMGMPTFQRSLALRPSRTGASASSTTKSTRAKSKPTSPQAKETVAERRASRAASSTATRDLEESDAHPHTEEHDLIWPAVGAGMAASGLLMLSVTFWNWATQAKFYTLHFAFVVALLWLALCTRRAIISGSRRSVSTPRWPPSSWSPAIRLLHLLAFTIGLSLTNHYLTFLLLPGIALFLLTPFRYAGATLRLVGRHAGTIVLAGILPLLIYLYLPISAALHPLLAWGSPYTLVNFWRQVTAQTYQGFFGASDLGNHIVDASIYAANQFGPWLGLLLLVPIVAGLAYLWRADRGLLAATAVTALVTLVVTLNYNIREIATYYVPFYIVCLWWAGLGVAQGIAWVQHRLSPAATGEGESSRGTMQRNPAMSLALAAILPLVALLVNWGAAGHQNNYTGELFIRNMFKNYGQNAVVLTNYWDLTSGAFYLQHVLNERTDVTIIDKTLLRQPFYLDYLERNYPELLSKNAAPYQAYKPRLLQWIATGKPPAGLNDSYLGVLNGFIDSNLGQRPVYADFVAEANDVDEQADAHALFANHQGKLVPNNLGYRIPATSSAEELRAQDPQFDFRGVTTEKVPLDEIETSVIALYPSALKDIGTYMQNSPTPGDKEVGARLLAQAQELQPLALLHNARPRLR